MQLERLLGKFKQTLFFHRAYTQAAVLPKPSVNVKTSVKQHAVVSVFDLFSIGIGPSSSHTVGPMRAARMFLQSLIRQKLLDSVYRIQTDLYGSLALTGVGHGTPKAVLLGLEGETPEHVSVLDIGQRIERINHEHILNLNGTHPIPFNYETDLCFRKQQTLHFHSNGLCFSAFSKSNSLVYSCEYFSIGGGFVVEPTKDNPNSPAQDSTSLATPPAIPSVKLPFGSAKELLDQCASHNLTIGQVVLENELAWNNIKTIEDKTLLLWNVMDSSIKNGCLSLERTLPGGLNLPRRAPGLLRQLYQQSGIVPSGIPKDEIMVEKPDQPAKIQSAPNIRPRHLDPLDYMSLYAMAVNEENAAGGRVVTAPTNGAAGVIPAVLKYYLDFILLPQSPNPTVVNGQIITFLHTAAAIGMLYKHGASISAARVGCQGEVGVACSMSAGALVAVQGGTPDQVEKAAEVAMEHCLGLTCDPVGGLVQIPCIERNAIGASKAVTSAQLALREVRTDHQITLDQVIATMLQTGDDMHPKYKETSLGGLASTAPLC